MANDPKNPDSVFFPYIIDHPILVITDKKGAVIPLQHITGSSKTFVFGFAL